MPSPSAIAWATQRGVKLAANHLLDQPANPVTDSVLDGIKPIVEKMGVNLGRRRRKLRRRGNPLHGVVSCPALKRRVIRGSSPRRLRHHQFLPTQRRDPWSAAHNSDIERLTTSQALWGSSG